MANNNTDWWANAPDGVKYLVLGALFSSVVSGGVNLGKDTSDRFKGADFAKEIRVRDEKIKACQQDISDLQVAVSDFRAYRIEHTRHAAIYTERIDEMWRIINRVPADEVNSSIRDLKKRLRELEIEVARQRKANGH